MATVAAEAAPAMAAVEVDARHSVERPVEAAPESACTSAAPIAVEVSAEPKAEAEAELEVAPEAARTSLIEPKAEGAPAPLWPKQPQEWGLFLLDLGPIGMVYGALSGSCPAIGSLPAFVISFAALAISVGTVKFVFSLRRCGQAKHYPAAKSVADVLGLLMMGVGVWGIAITYPNLRYLDGPESECEKSPFLGALIPSTIILVVLVVLAGFCGKAAIASLSKPAEVQKADGEATQQEKDLEKAV